MRSNLTKRLLLASLVVPVFLQARQQPDSLQVQTVPDSLATRDVMEVMSMPSILLAALFHNPPVAILNDRPFKMDFFVNFDPEEIESVALLMRVDSASNFQEIPLTGEYNRYRYMIPKEDLQGSALNYYFLVILKDYRLYAYPKNAAGSIEPYLIDLVPPTKEFFQQHLYD